MKLPKLLFGVLATLGVIVNSQAAEAAIIDSVNPESPIILRQNDVIQHTFTSNINSDQDALSHYSHSSHASHASHSSHSSHYSYTPQE